MKKPVEILDDRERLYWDDVEYEVGDIEVLALRLEHLCAGFDLTKDNVEVYLRSFKEVSSYLNQHSNDLRWAVYELQYFLHTDSLFDKVAAS